MNTETQSLMEQPRCGCPDFPESDTSNRFTTVTEAWSTFHLTYNVLNTTSTFSQNLTDDVMAEALQKFSEVTPLTFTKTSGPADLDIFFVSRDHEDGYPFDGRGSVLAHAFFPRYGGDAHFDYDEDWTLKANGVGIDLLFVAVHEFGHSLGLGHSEVRAAIMYPFYSYLENVTLHSDDIAGIQSLYNLPTTTEESVATSEEPQATETPTSTCLFNNIDAITSDKSGNIFIFHGPNYTLVDHKGIVDGFPREISTDFPEIVGTVDAAVYLPAVIKDKCVIKKGIKRCYSVVAPEEAYIFAGDSYYRYTTGYLESKRMRGSGFIGDKFVGVPKGTILDAAFTYDGTDIYLVSGDEVWLQIRGKKNVDSSSPLSLTNDLVYGMPVPNDVLSLPTTSTFYNFFFVGDMYYRTSNGGFQPDNATYPRKISDHWCDKDMANDLGFYKHHSVYVEKDGERIIVPEEFNL